MLQRHFFVKFSWFEFAGHEARIKWPQFSMTHGVHCSCQLFPLPHRNEPISAPCAYTRRRLSPLHVSATCPLVCADRKDVAFDYLWDSQFTKLKLLLLHPTIIFVFRKGLQRGTIWIDFRQIIVTMQFFTNRWGKECKVYGCKMTDSSSWIWNKGSHNHHRVWIPDLYWRRFCDLVSHILFWSNTLDGF